MQNTNLITTLITNELTAILNRAPMPELVLEVHKYLMVNPNLTIKQALLLIENNTITIERNDDNQQSNHYEEYGVQQNPYIATLIHEVLGIDHQTILQSDLPTRIAWFFKVNAMFLTLPYNDETKELRQKIKDLLKQASVAEMTKKWLEGSYFVTVGDFDKHDDSGYSHLRKELRLKTESHVLNMLKENIGIFNGHFTFDYNHMYIFQWVKIPDIVHKTIIIPKDDFTNFELDKNIHKELIKNVNLLPQNSKHILPYLGN